MRMSAYACMGPCVNSQMYRKHKRYRATDLFMEIDKDHSLGIDIAELLKFVR